MAQLLPKAGDLKSKLEDIATQLSSRVSIRDLLLVILALHLLTISQPSSETVFDEAYYIPAARELLAGKATNVEHPFLGKLWIALGILVFGDNWFGWRIVTVAFGILSVYMLYKLARIYMNHPLALYSAALLGFENMFFVHSSIAVLDIPSIFFGILGIYFYLRGMVHLSSGSLAISVLSKETGIFFVFMVLLHALVEYLRAGRVKVPYATRKAAAKSLAFIAIFSLLVLGLITLYDMAYKPTGRTTIQEQIEIAYVPTSENTTLTLTTTSRKTIKENLTNAIDHILFTYQYATSLTTNSSQNINSGNYAWNWILPLPDPYPPSSYYVLNVNKTIHPPDSPPFSRLESTISWIGVGNMPLWWTFWLSVPFSIYCLMVRKERDFSLIILLWVLATYAPMLFMSAVVKRIVYPFYFLQTVPAIALAFPMIINAAVDDRAWRILLLGTFLAVVILFFFRYFPVNIFYSRL